MSVKSNIMASPTAGIPPPDTPLPLRSDTILPLVIPPTGILFLLALIAYSARMYNRIFPHLNLSWDDFTMTLAVVSLVSQFRQRN